MFGRKFGSQTSRIKQIIALCFLFILSTPILVDSQNQELTWGFDAGKKFYFEETDTWYRNESIFGSQRYRYYIVTRNNYTITDPLTWFPLAEEQEYFYNGSPYLRHSLEFAVPIGDWDLLETVFLSQYSIYFNEISIIDNDTTWGFQIGNSTEFDESQSTFFSKTDGVLLFFQYSFVGPTTGPLSGSLDKHIDRISAPLDINSILFVTYSSIILIVLVGAYFFRKPRVK